MSHNLSEKFGQFHNAQFLNSSMEAKEESSDLKSGEEKTRHVQKLAHSKKLTFFVLSSWNLVEMVTKWGDYFH